jgi:probable F420-dependent oxidoreductase
MRYGINLPNYGPLGHRAELLGISDAAVELGYESVWVSDHILMPNSMPEPYGSIVESLSTLAFLAGRSDRLLLGSSVIVLAQRDPILLAKQAAAVHELSGGRLVLGVGVGWVQGEYELLGAPWADRGRTADEYIEVMQTLWTQPDPRHDGPRISFGDALFAPRPRPGSTVPLVVGGHSRAALARAARYADGWQAIHCSPEDIRSARAVLTQLAPDKHLDVSLRIGVHVHGPVPRPVGPVIQGNPDEVRQTVAAYADAGVDQLIVEFRERDLDQFLEQMGHFAREVLAPLPRGRG